MYLRKQQLDFLPIEDLCNLPEPEFIAKLEEINIKQHQQWMLPQLVNYFSGWRILEDGLETVLDNCKTNLDKSLYRLTRIPRSCLVQNQTKQPEYSQLVPIILLAHKQYKDKLYEQWRGYPKLEWLLEPLIWEALQVEPPLVDKDTLLELLNRGLGQVRGKPRNPQSAYKIYKLRGTELDNLPHLLQTMMLQNWLCHPQIRHKHMIVNPKNWDLFTEPLVEVEVLKISPNSTPLPWLI